MTKSVCPGITFFPENMESYVSILRLLDIIKPIRFLSKKQKQLVLQIAVCNPCLKLCRGKDQTKKSCCFPKCTTRNPEDAEEHLFFSLSSGSQMCGSGQHPPAGASKQAPAPCSREQHTPGDQVSGREGAGGLHRWKSLQTQTALRVTVGCHPQC